jgi:hypothetical protein
MPIIGNNFIFILSKKYRPTGQNQDYYSYAIAIYAAMCGWTYSNSYSLTCALY